MNSWRTLETISRADHALRTQAGEAAYRHAAPGSGRPGKTRRPWRTWLSGRDGGAFRSAQRVESAPASVSPTVVPDCCPACCAGAAA